MKAEKNIISTKTTIESLKLLAEIGQILVDGKLSGAALPRFLEKIHQTFGFSRSYVITHDKTEDKLQIKASLGFSATEFRHLEANIEKSFLMKVLHNAKTVILPKANLESTYLSKFIGQNDKNVEISGIGVPIVLRKESFGVFGVEFNYEKNTNYEQIADLLSVIALMIAQAIKVEYIIENEKERLFDENTYLKRELREKYDFGHIIGNSSAMKRVYAQISQV
ncbi:MAG: hypothetical protein ABI686_08670, partial [Acidobacteriota bacterium]